MGITYEDLTPSLGQAVKIRELAIQIKEKEKQVSDNPIDIKEKIKCLKKKMTKKIDYNSELTEELLDLYIDKITVHKDKFDWKLNYLSDKIESDNEEQNSKGIFFTRLLITNKDIVDFNNTKKYLKKVRQKEPIIMDIYI